MTFAQQLGSTPGDYQEVEILIVGFGFSVIPLLRELEARKQTYTLISEGDTIWQQLASRDRLDFDMVSSFHASFYAEDQVKAGTVESYYATARDFYEYNQKLYSQYKHRVIEDRVASVENHATHSFVRTTRGRSYKAHKLVFATGLTRPQNETIKNIWPMSAPPLSTAEIESDPEAYFAAKSFEYIVIVDLRSGERIPVSGLPRGQYGGLTLMFMDGIPYIRIFSSDGLESGATLYAIEPSGEARRVLSAGPNGDFELNRSPALMKLRLNVDCCS